MRLVRFRVRNYRNVIDSGPIDVDQITAIVGQNESGKSNLCEALFRLNPFDGRSAYNINEDWPVDRWGDRDQDAVVCEATFQLDGPAVSEFLDKVSPPASAPPSPADAGAGSPPAASKAPSPARLHLTVSKRYNGKLEVAADPAPDPLDDAKLLAWVKERMPKCVYVHEYNLSGTQTELDQLAAKHKQQAGTRSPPRSRES